MRHWWHRIFDEGKRVGRDGLSAEERAARAAASTYEDEPVVEPATPGVIALITRDAEERQREMELPLHPPSHVEESHLDLELTGESDSAGTADADSLEEDGDG
jgi:hypothetical protein